MSDPEGDWVKTRLDSCEFHGEYDGEEVFIDGNWIDNETPCQKCLDEKMAGKRDYQVNCPTHGQHTIHQTWITMLGQWVGSRSCQKCSDEVEQKESARITANARAAKEGKFKARVKWCQENSQIPEKFGKTTLGNYRPTCQEGDYALRVALKYSREFQEQKDNHRCLLLLGGIGNGKTHLACGIGHAIINAGFSVSYTSINRVTLEIRSTYRRDVEETEDSVIKKYLKSDLLILDEIGVGRNTAAEAVTMHDLLSGRYDKGLPTLITSNLAPDALKLILGDRLISRLHENKGIEVPFTWEDYRKRGA